MKIFTSYFYQIRHMKPYQVPISTAVSDPKWFHMSRGNAYRFFDRRGVLNGMRCEYLHPNSSCADLCVGSKKCQYDYSQCNFLKAYRSQIFSLDYNRIIEKFTVFAEKFKNIIRSETDIELILIVYEIPGNPCSERAILQEFFKCEEFIKT